MPVVGQATTSVIRSRCSVISRCALPGTCGLIAMLQQGRDRQSTVACSSVLSFWVCALRCSCFAEQSSWTEVITPDGRLAGRISMVFGSFNPNLCVACKWHGCKFMVQSHRVQKGATVEQWLIEGQFQTKAQHENSFFVRAGIVPPVRGGGQSRGSAR